MSTRSPSKSPFNPKNIIEKLSRRSSSGRERQVAEEKTMSAALKQISNSLANVDFDRFFKIFGPHTAVFHFISEFDFDKFSTLILKAFPVVKVDGRGDVLFRPSEVQATLRAKKDLKIQVEGLDNMFKEMHSAGLNVGNIRAALKWLRHRISDSYAELLECPLSSTLNDNPIPKAPELRLQVPSVGQFLAPPPIDPSPTTEAFPEDAFSTSMHVPSPTPPSPTRRGRSHSTSRPDPPHTPEKRKTASPQPLAVINADPRTYNWDPRAVPPHTPEEKAALIRRYQRIMSAGAPHPSSSSSHSPSHRSPSHSHPHSHSHSHPYPYSQAQPPSHPPHGYVYPHYPAAPSAHYPTAAYPHHEIPHGSYGPSYPQPDPRGMNYYYPNMNPNEQFIPSAASPRSSRSSKNWK